MKTPRKTPMKPQEKKTSDSKISISQNSQNEIQKDWEKQMAQKNAAILKSIEDLIDKSLKNNHE